MISTLPRKRFITDTIGSRMSFTCTVVYDVRLFARLMISSMISSTNFLRPA